MSNIIISSGEDISGESISNVTISSGGQLTVSPGNDVYGVTLLSGGQLNILPDGSVSAVTISSGGQLTISSGASASRIGISSGGLLTISSGASPYNIDIYSGGQLTALSGASPSRIGISSGGQLTVSSGAYIDTTWVFSGAQLTASSGAHFHYTSIYAGGQQTILPGANVDVAWLSSGAQLTAPSGANLSTVIISSGAQFNAFSGASIANISTLSGGQFTVSEGVNVTNINTLSGGQFTVSSGGNVSNATISSGGQLTVSPDGNVYGVMIFSGGKLNGEVTLNNGSSVIYPDAGGTINMLGNNNGLTITGLKNGGTVTTIIKNFDGVNTSLSDRINLEEVKTSNVTNVAYEDANGNANGDYVTLSLNDGNKIVMNIPGAQKEGYALTSDREGNLIYEVCFLAGSMIKTPEGAVAVEDLRIGDKVLTFNWQKNKEEIKSVRWVGNKATKVNPNLHDDEAGYPVRIVKDAIAEGIPSKDLLITPEHCLFFDGKFTPARMLVNGYSIYYDYSITNYTYYHIETEEHSVIWADNMLTESYLNTGNQTQFKQHGEFAVLTRPSNPKTWEENAAAPLVVDRNYVEPLYHTFLQRAMRMALPMMQAPKHFTNDPGLHLITEAGLVIRPISNFNGKYVFSLPTENMKSVYLVSRVSRLSDVIGPFEDNRHELGVLVKNIQLVDSKSIYNIQISNLTEHLTQQNLLGWHALENTTSRWTKGKALLNLPKNHSQQLMIDICCDRAYLLDQNAEQSIAI